MEDLEKKIPYELTVTLNKFNVELTKIKNEVTMEASSTNIKISNSNQTQITISYRIKNLNFYFIIYFITGSDLIHWKYYPYNKTSTKSTTVGQASTSDPSVFSRLLSTLISWKQLIENYKTIENPINFFLVDDFIKFYSDEILEEIPENETENKFPLSSAKQIKALKLIELQIQFLDREIINTEDQSSEKYNDLVNSKKLIEKIRENLPRLTASEVKKNWSISLAGIKKWCGEKFIQFLKLDKESGHDLSRTLGSFIGGIFGIPKLDG
jgi:hypothetical protein